DTFTYTLSDGALTDTATVTVTITGVNDAPVAIDDMAMTDEDTAVNIPATDLLANDSDPESDPLTVTDIDGSGTVGQVTFDGTTVTYDPNGQFEALNVGETATDTFTYTLSDGALTDTATVTVTITGVNDAPVAIDDMATTDEDTAVNIPATDLLANDSDPESDPLTVTDIDGSGTVGQVTFDGTTVTYDPNGQFEALNVGETATDTFTYTLSDGALTDTATVTVTITGVNDAPVAIDDMATTDEDTAVNIPVTDLLANDSDPENDPLTVTSVDATATVGTVVFDGTTVTYDPNGMFAALNVGETATDTFTYTLSDGSLTDTATVTVTITGVDDNEPVVEVDDDFDSNTPGFGVNRFDNVFDAVNAVASGGRILLFDGDYQEAVQVDKPVILELDTENHEIPINTTLTGRDSTLLLVGSMDAENVTFGQTADLSQVVANFNSQPATNEALPVDAPDRTLFNLTGNVGFTAVLLGGNDRFQLAADEDINIQVFAGAGDDYVLTGDGDDLVFGGLGNDTLSTNGGNDVLVGGMGFDQGSAGGGNDVLVSGFMLPSFSITQFYELRNDWAPDGTVNSTALGTNFKNAAQNDNVIDIFSGGSGVDLISFFRLGGAFSFFFDDQVTLGIGDVDASTL
ncbi:MAG: Ig-like domain-containing protein, partial [Gemmataceae bacterium]